MRKTLLTLLTLALAAAALLLTNRSKLLTETTPSRSPAAPSASANSHPNSETAPSSAPPASSSLPSAAAYTSHLPEAWKQAPVLAESIETVNPNNPSITRRIRILQTNGFPFPVRVEERIDSSDPSVGPIIQLVSVAAANQVLLSSPSPLAPDEIEILAEQLGWQVRPSTSPHISILETSDYDLDTVQNTISLLQTSDLPFASEPNLIYFTALSPNDPKYSSPKLWHLDTSNDQDIDAPEAWEIRTSAPNIKIAIVDTGIRLDHEDLVSNLWTNSDEIPNNGKDDDNNGYVDDIHGFNTILNKQSPNDDNGHGTHVAGIAGAAGNNNKGVSGVAWNVKLMAVKALNTDGAGSLKSLIEAIDYATLAKANIINASWGSPYQSFSLNEAVQRSANQGIIFVAAAGNSSASYPFYPANAPSPNIISVGASNEDGKRAHFSNFGWRTVDVFAPGTNILSTWNSSSKAYIALNGTSMATPIVSGQVALDLAQFPNDDMDTQIRRVFASIDRQDTFKGFAANPGITNLNTSLRMTRIPKLPTIFQQSEDITLLEGQSTSFHVEAESDIEISYQWYFNDLPIDGQNAASIELGTVAYQQMGTYTVEVSNADGSINGTFELTVYPRIPDFETAMESNIQIFASDPELWNIQTEGENRYLANSNIPPAHQAKLIFLLPHNGLLDFDLYVSEAALERLNFPILPHHKIISTNTWTKNQFLLRFEQERQITLTLNNNNPNYTVPANALRLGTLYLFPEEAMPPFITSHPRSKTYTNYQDAKLEVQAEGQNLSYQWFKDGQPIDKATNARLDIPFLEESDNGDYLVTVSNANGHSNSNPATISVQNTPTAPYFIDNAQRSTTYLDGERLRLNREAVGEAPIAYQWYFGEIPIPNATSSTLEIGPLSVAHRGIYKAKATNSIGSSISSYDSITVDDRENIRPPKFPNNGINETIYLTNGQGPVILNFPYPQGSPPFDFTLYKDGAPIQLPLFTIPVFLQSAKPDIAGVYQIEVRNRAGADLSKTIELVVNPTLAEAVDFDTYSFENSSPNTISTEHSHAVWTESQSHDGIDSVHLYHDGVSNSPIQLIISGMSQGVTFSFYYKTDKLDGAPLQLKRGTYPSITLPNTTEWTEFRVHVPHDAWALRFELSSINESRSFWIDQVTISDLPTVFEEVSHDAPVIGWPVTIRAAVAGPNLTYKWYKDDQLLEQATTDEIHIPAFSANNQGNYKLEAKNEYGTTTTEVLAIIAYDSITQVFDTNFDFFLQNGLVVDSTTTDETNGFNLLTSDFLDDDTATFTASISGPASLVVEYSQFTAEGTITIGSSSYDLSQTGQKTTSSFPIPSGSQQLAITFKSSHPAHHFTLYSVNIQEAPVILEQATLFDSLWSRDESEHAPSLTVAGSEPFTLEWMKNDTLISTQHNIPSGAHSLFSRTLSHDDEGIYRCRITDTYGNVTTSRDMEVRHASPYADILDVDVGTIYRDHKDLTIDYADFTAGDSSLSINGPFLKGGTELKIEYAFIKSFSIKTSGFPAENPVEILDSQGKRKSIATNSQWEKINFDDSPTYYLTIRVPENANPEAAVKLDAISPYDGILFSSVPHHHATYLGAPIHLSAQVDSTRTDTIHYQWIKDGSPLPSENEANLIIEALAPDDLGEYQLRAYQDSGLSKISPPALISLLSEELGAAIGIPGAKITTRGNTLWRIDQTTTFKGPTSIRSGPVLKGEISEIRIEIPGPALWAYHMKNEYNDDWYIPESGKFSSRESPDILVASVSGNYLSDDTVNFPIKWIDDVVLESISDQSFETWSRQLKESSNITFSDSDLLAESDFDSDNIPNWAEFALGFDPSAPNQLPAFGSFIDNSGQRQARLKLRHTQNPNFSLSFEISFDLETWFRSDASLALLKSDDRYDEIEATLNLHPSANQPLFYRWVIRRSGEIETPSIYTFGN